MTTNAHSFQHSGRLAWSVLIVSLLITLGAWTLSHRYLHEKAELRFQSRVEEVTEAISQRMTDYEQVLRGALGFYQASETITRKQWKVYVENANLQRFYPGIQGLGVSVFVQPEDKEVFEARVRAEGFPKFAITPSGPRPVYTSILYLEPFDWRNQRAFGYDMYSQDTRRLAMDQAIATGEPAITDIVRLVQETDEDVQPGFLLYLPLFDQTKATETTEERQAAIRGFVYAPFRATDLMDGILRKNLPDLEFRIFDGVAKSHHSLLYSSSSISEEESTRPPRFTGVRSLNLRGREWLLEFESIHGFVRSHESWLSLLVGISGLCIDVLLYFMINAISKQRREAIAVAETTTAELRCAQEQFQAVCDNANDPIIVVTSDQKILYCNQATNAVFGYEPEALYGEVIQCILCDFDDVAEKIKKADSDTRQRKDCRGFCKNGTSPLFSVMISTWSISEKQYFAVNLRDITADREKERLIQQHIVNLERSNRDLDDFAYVASHDLRTPLRNIDSLAQWVKEDVGHLLPEENRDHLEHIQGRIERMDQLLDDLLEYSRVGKLEERILKVEPKALVEDILTMNGKAEGFKVTLDIDIAPLTTLKTPLETCLRNLISNAIKHHDRADGCLEISAKAYGDCIDFTIADDGPGIPPEFHGKVFGIFQTAVESRNSTNGSGVGLAIVKKTAEAFGGEVLLDSELGEGARFTLRWPSVVLLAE